MRVYLIGEIKEIRRGKGFSRKKLANRISHLCKQDFKKKDCVYKDYTKSRRGEAYQKRKCTLYSKST